MLFWNQRSDKDEAETHGVDQYTILEIINYGHP